MATLYIEPVQESGEILPLVRSAIESEVAKLELALKVAVKRLGCQRRPEIAFQWPGENCSLGLSFFFPKMIY